MTGPAVELRELFRVYSTPDGGVAALQGLTMSVREGEVCVVLGPSGSGKTTLLRILAGLDRPSAGRAVVLGHDLARLSGRRLAAYRARELGYADQHYWRALADELTARELVALQLGLAGAGKGERERRADELLERVGLLDRRGARPHELSGGEQQRIAVCAALAHRPRLFLADEPTGELDSANASLVYDLIGDLARSQGTTTLIVSHDPESAAIADRIVRVRDGRVSDEAAPTDGDGEAIVVGKGGWLRLPEELLRRAGIQSRATARLESEGIVVSAAVGGAAAEASAAIPLPQRETSAAIAAQVRDLTKTFGSGDRARTVLESLGASFGEGRLVAVTGPSGSGKTTLLHLLAGLELPTAGEVSVVGTPLSRLDRTARAAFRRERIAFIGQQPALVPFLSALENVELGQALRRLPAGHALESLVAVGLAEQAGQRVGELSSGQRERVAVARALAARPALLLADEPTSRLDQANALAVARLFVRLARETGTTIVCATHDPLVIEQADAELALGPPGPGLSSREVAGL